MVDYRVLIYHIFLHIDRLDLIEKFVAKKTGQNYESAMIIRKNINEWKSLRGASIEGMWIFFPPKK